MTTPGNAGQVTVYPPTSSSGYLEDELLRAERCRDIRDLQPQSLDDWGARGEVDVEFFSAAQAVSHLDAGWPITPLKA